MRWLILMAATAPLAAQTPVANIINTDRPAAHDFQTGDHFRIVIAGAANQPVSVRTSRQNRTDWGPVAGSTDWSGRWSIEGQFAKTDFGAWEEVWTVGGKLANPVLDFSVGANCLEGGRSQLSASGPNVVVFCDTTAGPQAFATPSDTDPIPTPDGRIIPPRTHQGTAEQYHAEMTMYAIISDRGEILAGNDTAEAADLILKTIGVNALTGREIQNVLAMIRAGRPAKSPTRVLLLLQTVSDSTADPALKRKIAETVAFMS